MLTMKPLRMLAAALFALSASAVATAQINLQLITEIDVVGVVGASPSSIAAHGTDLYVGTGGADGVLYKVTDALGAPTLDTTFGTLPGEVTIGDTTNGYVSLHTDGTTLVAATNNGGTFSDLVKVYDITGAPSLNWESDSGTLGIASDRIDGAAVNPVSGDVWLTSFGAGFPTILDTAAPTDESDAPSNLFAQSPSGTGWRDLTFDDATGDIYLRGTNGVVAGVRSDVDDFTTLNSAGATAGTSQIAGDNTFGNLILQDSFQSAINIEFLPAALTGGEEAFITNTRVSGSTVFGDQVLAYDANAGFDGGNPFSLDPRGIAVALNFLEADGVTPFTTDDSDSAVYDFSYNAVNEYLYVSDLSNGSVYVFGVPGSNPAIEGDFNDDGLVDNGDLNLLLSNWGSAIVPPEWVNGFEAPVDNGELNALLGNWGAGVGAAVPEPAPAGLLLLAAAMVRSRRR